MIYNDSKCYIGKTTIKYVSSRIAKHKYLYKNKDKYQCSCKIIFDEGNWHWKVIETGISKELLSEREQFYINNSENCINKCKVLISEEDKINRSRELSKKYYEKNKGTEKDPNFNKREYKAIWSLKKKYGDDWIYHTKNSKYKIISS